MQADLKRLHPLAVGADGELDLEALAFLAAGVPQGRPGVAAKRPDLSAAIMKRIYALDQLGEFPSRADVRRALVLSVFREAGGILSEAAARTTKPFNFDSLSKRVYLRLAGMETGNVLQADEMLLKKAFGIGTLKELPAAVVREASKPQVPPTPGETFQLEDFALAIRRLARPLVTKPYAGRVAIAQVYDAGITKGLSLGSLDEFKDNLAEAAREGLLDLERYDIAGPFDAALKERSRLRLGRDERHFIVNQWT